MMENRYVPVYVVSEIRLLVGCLCTVTAACAKDHLPRTKDYLESLSFTEEI